MAEEYDEIDREVLGLAGRRPSALLDDDQESNAPLGRLTTMELDNVEYAEEYRLHLINRLLIRNVPLDQIAQQLRMTIPQVMSARNKIREMHKRNARTLSTDFIVGDTDAFYREIIGIAMRAASVNKSPMPIRLLALKTAMAAKRELNQFFLKAKVIDATPYAPDNADNVDDMTRIMSALDKLLEEEDEPKTHVPLQEDQTTARVVARPSRRVLYRKEE